MTEGLPQNLLALFAPRDPLPFVPPVSKPVHHRKLPYTGVAQFLSEFEDPSETPAATRAETREERKERKRKERQEQVAYRLEQDLALWDPKNDHNAKNDPYKTLFVARVNFDTTEAKLKREFEVFGDIKSICMVKDMKSGKPRGYAFIEYIHQADMHAAYKHADGRKIDGRRVLVDVERARTVRGWRPRRLGGGMGSTRKGPTDVRERERSRSRERDARRYGRSSRDKDKDKDRRSKRKSKSKSRERRRRSRSRDKDRDKKRRSRSRDRRRDKDKHRHRDKTNGANVDQYGEYGAEIRAEYGDDL